MICDWGDDGKRSSRRGSTGSVMSTASSVRSLTSSMDEGATGDDDLICGFGRRARDEAAAASSSSPSSSRGTNAAAAGGGQRQASGGPVLKPEFRGGAQAQQVQQRPRSQAGQPQQSSPQLTQQRKGSALFGNFLGGIVGGRFGGGGAASSDASAPPPASSSARTSPSATPSVSSNSAHSEPAGAADGGGGGGGGAKPKRRPRKRGSLIKVPKMGFGGGGAGGNGGGNGGGGVEGANNGAGMAMATSPPSAGTAAAAQEPPPTEGRPAGGGGAPAPQDEPAAPTTAAATDDGSGQQPTEPRRRPRRRGSVVKSQMHGSDGDHVQPTSAGAGADIPDLNDLASMMAVDNGSGGGNDQGGEDATSSPAAGPGPNGGGIKKTRSRHRGSLIITMGEQSHGHAPASEAAAVPKIGVGTVGALGTGVVAVGNDGGGMMTTTSPDADVAMTDATTGAKRGGALEGDDDDRGASKAGGGVAEGDNAKRQRRKKMGRKAIHGIAMDMDFELKVVPKSEDEQDLIYEAIKTNTLFKTCTDEEFVDIVDAFEPRSCTAGSIVIKEGDEGDLFYVMERGGVDVYEKDRRVCSLFSGAAFGEIALLYGCPRTATLRAKYDCKLWVIDRRTFRGITGQHKRRLLEKKLDFLKKVKIHNKVLGEVLDISELQDMAVATKSEQFVEGEAIVTQGERGDVFYMIEEGTVDVYIKEKGNRPLVTLKSGQFFGEKALLSADVRTATCIASSHVKCMYLMRDDFNLLLGDLQDLLNRSYEDRRYSLPPIETEPAESMDVEKSKPEFSIDDFDVKRTLGVGAFGYVKLVRLKNSDHVDTSDDGLYALKCISKEKIAEHKHQEKIINEESIMTELVHPCIARCFCAMQDNKAKYFLMEALCGGELCELLYNERMFTEDWSRFYSASVLLAFCFMHARKIAYRDLKPENLVLNSAGYVKIVDFGLAKRLSDGRTHTFCGTPDYLAPEIILNEAYDWAVDYWGLGILLYEMTAGEAPFAAENPMDVYEKVLACEFVVPPHFSRELEDLIRRLLHTSQSKRLGRTRGGGEAVMKHRWYSGFDWDALLAYKMRVPHVPRVKDEDDDSFCDEDQEEGFASPIL